MGLFEDLGERVERFKQQAVDASKEQASYECLECGEPVYTDQEACPHCGSEGVVERVRETQSESVAGGDSPSESAESDATSDSDSTDTREPDTSQDDDESSRSSNTNTDSNSSERD